MSSMSYCRFQNGASDMSDMVEDMRRFSERDEDACADNEAAIEGGMDVANDNPTRLEVLSEFERSSMLDCLRLAAEMLELAGEELLRDADINLARLGA